ncbi:MULTISPECIES: hypothetical protein [unclassified Stenotrophomonas]|uniref:hypothetical protein n=1 Tax=unclassified Stenotrophomonas TaxID=196198 RepID=UPI003F9CC5D2
MSLIFLASAFEEFVREQAIQCGNQLAENYAEMPTKSKNTIRDSYWSVSRDRFKFTRSILLKNTPDPLLLARVKLALSAMQGFVIDDDASKLDSQAFGHHSNNFRPAIVVEIFGRFAIRGLMDQLGENTRLKNYFGVSTKKECSEKLIAKWNEFYDRRNETVHSLSGKTGFAVDAIISYIELFELTAEALRAVLAKTLKSWS